MKSKTLSSAVVALLAIVFTIALTFATIEIPHALARFAHENWDIPDIHPAIEPEAIEEFITSNHLRLIGFTCLAAVGLLIIAGFVVEMKVLSSAGAILFFLPTFGYFAIYMFFLAGLGILRVLWLPFWGDLIKLGDIAFVPFMIIVYPLALLGIRFGFYLAILLIGLGLLIFLWGTFSWFYAKWQGKGTVDFWPYRFSRHPQYLGWVVWSYGLMLLASQVPIVRAGENPGASLPWAISSLVIICVALGEEIKMTRERGEEYATYQASVPFLLPLPRLVYKVITAPMRLFLHKDRPETRKDLLVIFLIYLGIIMLLSLPILLLDVPGYAGWGGWP